MAKPQTHNEWLDYLRQRPDQDILAFMDDRTGKASKRAAQIIWQERQDAKNQTVRDEEFQKLKTIKQERESEHTLWRYWCLATWPERFGMLGFLFFVFIVGFGVAQIPSLTEFLNLIKNLIP